MSRFTAIDLSLVPPPGVVETLNFETIFSAMLGDLQSRDPAFTALVESDPAYKILEVCAYRELLLRQRINDASRAVMLAYATGTDLDNLAALLGVQRLTITPPELVKPDGDYPPAVVVSGAPIFELNGTYLFNGGYTSSGGPEAYPIYVKGNFTVRRTVSTWRVRYTIEPIENSGYYSSSNLFGAYVPNDPPTSYFPAPGCTVSAYNPDVVEPYPESDADFRRRIQLALEAFSTAGPEGAYIFHALSASPDVLDVGVTSPSPGNVTVAVLSRTGEGGAAPLATLNAVTAALNSEDVRPLTDAVTVQSASILNYEIIAQLYVYPGPDSEVVRQNAIAAARKYADDTHRVGLDVALSGIYAALHQPGVQRVVLTQPAANITASMTQATFCTAITVTVAGVDE